MDQYYDSSNQRKTKNFRAKSRKSLLTAVILVGMAVVSLLLSSNRVSFSSTIRMLSSTEQKQHDANNSTFKSISTDTTGDESPGGHKQSFLSSFFHNNDNNATLDRIIRSSTTISLEQKSAMNNVENKSLDDNTLKTLRISPSQNMTETHKTAADYDDSGPESSSNHHPINSQTNNTDQRMTTNDYDDHNSSRSLTIVVQLSGELGNQVFKLANGLCVQDHVEQELGIPTKLVLRAQDHAKWKHAMEWTKEAFPKTRPLEFREGNTPEFDSMHKLQEKWVDRQLSSALSNKNHNSASIPDLSLLKALSCAEPKCISDVLKLVNQTWYLDDADRPTIPSNSNFSIPHLYVTSFVGHHCWDRMYETYRDFFQIDETAICRQVPDADESVLHLRNFLVEMPRRGKKLGFEQLGPNETASRIFRHHQTGDKVAIISRFPDKTQDFIDALKETKGIEARYIEGQTGNQDFCFLWKAQKEIIGQKVSTFVSLAGMLGNAKKVRLYSVESLETRTRSVHFFNETFENEALRKRIVYENYNLTYR